ncbi:hypothetical protein [Halopiger thermotolerans]
MAQSESGRSDLERPDIYECHPELADTVTGIDENDLLIVNGDSRTWEVTDIVDRKFDDQDDDRESKRAIRLTTRGRSDEPNAVFALVLVTYPDRYHCRLHVLRTPNWYEENETYPVESVRVLDMEPTWTVVHSSSKVFHLPDPRAAGRGEAHPACHGSPNTAEDADYRFAQHYTVRSSCRPCMDCARRYQPVNVSRITCPDCDRGIAGGVLLGTNVSALEGVELACPNRNCQFEGIVPLSFTE